MKVKKILWDMDVEIRRGIGQRLREARKQRKELKSLAKTGIEYGKELGIGPISPRTIEEWEKGTKPSGPSIPYHYLIWIFKRTKTDLNYLIFGD